MLSTSEGSVAESSMISKSGKVYEFKANRERHIKDTLIKGLKFC